MLRLLINSTFQQNRNFCFRPQQIFKNNFSNFKFNIQEQFTKTKEISRKSLRVNNFRYTCLAGLGIGFGCRLVLKQNNLKVFCDNRLAGSRNIDQETDRNKFDWKLFLSYLKQHILKLLGAIAAALSVAYLNISIPNLLGDLVNQILAQFNDSTNVGSFLKNVQWPAANLLLHYLAQSIFTFVYIYLLSDVGEQVAVQIRQDLFDKMILQDVPFFDHHQTGEVVNRIMTDVQDFKHSFKQCISQGLRSLAQLIGGAVSLFVISPHLAIFALISVPTAVLIGSSLGKKLRDLSKRSQAQNERAAEVCQEAFANIRTVKASACEHLEMELFQKEITESALLSQELGVGIAVFQALTNLFLNCMVLSTIYFGGHLMTTESMSPGQLMAFLVASQGVQQSLSQGSILLGTMIRGMTAGTRVFEYMKLEPKIDLVEGLVIPDEKLKGEIRFENVSFAYPTRSDQVVLKNFSLTLKPGSTVALVGASGSGKSTVAALLERFYEPTSGNIYIDDVKLSEISPVWLRSEVIGLIEQQPLLFLTTIFENIRYGRPNATKGEVIEAAKLSQAHSFVQNLPDGYQTSVGERGSQLSGGQRQRIAIGRALLKKPVILILDEATSALDAQSESIVQKALDDAVIDRTTLVIAHRLSTIQNADLIVVLNQGKIVETGNHNTLMKKKGLYYELVKQQQQEQSENEDPERSRG